MQGSLKDLIKLIEDKVRIVDVISDYITLEKKGNSYVGLCPFHSDSNPSLSVSESKKIFKCFTCGAGGSAISFVQNFEGISFIEAIKKVSEKNKINWKDYLSVREIKINPDKSRGWEINEEAMHFYTYTLKNASNEKVNAYITKRNFDEASINKFKIGFSGEGKSLNTFLIKKGFSQNEIIKYGLGHMNEKGIVNDLFINRLMFPIQDINGNVIAFSGRVIEEKSKYSKYMNSPETIIFKKSETLYNISNARSQANLQKEMIVVEGFMDVISLSKKGINNVIATMGTAFTKQHIQMLKNITTNITLAFDSDNAGINAAISSGKALIQEKMNVKVVSIPNGKDFDELFNLQPEQIKVVLNNKKSFLEFYKEKIYFVLDKNPNEIDLNKLRDLLKVIAIYDDNMLIDINLKEISKKYNIDIDIIKNEFQKNKQIKNVVKDSYKKNYLPPNISKQNKTISKLDQRILIYEETILIHAYENKELFKYAFDSKLTFKTERSNNLWNELKYSFENNTPIKNEFILKQLDSLKQRLDYSEIHNLISFQEYIENYQGMLEIQKRNKIFNAIKEDKDPKHQAINFKELKKIYNQKV